MGFAKWLHTGWPAGTVEKLPESNQDGTTALPGVRIVGDLTGIPLLKLSADSGAKAVSAILAEKDFQSRRSPEVLDLAIIGGGVAGISAALEAQKAQLRYTVFEAARTFSTIHDFPKQKPIYTYPSELKLTGQMQLTADVKESLVDELEKQAAGLVVEKANVERVERKGEVLLVHAGGKTVRALRVIIAIGRSGNFRKLGCAGETLDKVYHRLYDPNDHRGKNVLVVGGGDSALETAIALQRAGASVTLSHRRADFTRPKPDNVEALRASKTPVLAPSKLTEIRAGEVVLDGATLPNDVVFAMIGREAPLDFFRRSGIPIRGEWRLKTWLGLAAWLAFCVFVYNWKGGTALNEYFSKNKLFPFGLPSLGESPLGKALTEAVRQPSFYYTVAYTTAIFLFGIQRIRRRKTPYVTRQTLTLMAVQAVPLFLLPYIVLPWMGYAGVFSSGTGKIIADHLFPDQSWWRAFGFILAWPLFVWNFFNWKPLSWWLVIGMVQTFVLIPLIVRRWGKGAYCGWICSCGALAETVGDTQRQKMPHGIWWNRLNLVGQLILAWVFLLFAARAALWYWPNTPYVKWIYDNTFYAHVNYDYYHLVDIFLAGIVGVAFYFWASGRVWCRFACPLAALMHLYARAFSKFRIFAEKKKCISCNVCTTVCHQGIDVMSFANKGLPMEDPECVRCSACVQSCPTGTLTFGRVGGDGQPIYDRLMASPVQMAESKDGKRHLPLVARS